MKIAHKSESLDTIQTIAEHSISTGEIAKEFAIPELKRVVYNIALLHDIGKYQKSFQDKIIEGRNIRVDHSTCGAIEAKALFGRGAVSIIAQYCIAGHHTGLPNGGTKNDTIDDSTLQGRLSATSRFEDYSDYKNELHPEKISDTEVLELFGSAKKTENIIELFAFITRYCFSCLTDADSLDTIRFCTGRENTELKSDFKTCLDKINHKMDSFQSITELQKARSILQQQVYEKHNIDSEI